MLPYTMAIFLSKSQNVFITSLNKNLNNFIYFLLGTATEPRTSEKQIICPKKSIFPSPFPSIEKKFLKGVHGHYLKSK